ncbi:tRNA dihydrouridine synthase [Legionella micdadei]|uniref:tRNA-dihydrouridine synthase n=1 Tax=Legionella micdadei TaxID=451 RepID=A0A098GC29_LEGMI|nr:tRNA-dihydrouridine synthase family protein [Legionella micdadei]ARG96324.1 nitrogen regulation protein [Legionella micdadei]ARG99077.1 nitrogen regulation protein [Legionella micdadei]KTD29597.1 tRNA-dihydrouridine synthase B [Legionella micdadei]NSL19438.1 tRNA-dihydrouridine synthase family protein [Legionella micdadei]CEG59520.1 putative tRNA-dihydrouridine synthase [Legionella micdadei]
MQSFLNSQWTLGSLTLTHRLIQGPLAGFSCSPFRELFYQFTPPAYCVSEMISAHDVVHKHTLHSRYLHRTNNEKVLCYQIAGTDPLIMAQAATRLEGIGADLIDINCGCPKGKIRKKGAGSALLEKPQQLAEIVNTVRKAIKIPLTVKLRILGNPSDFELAKRVADVGADALIIHGRRWDDDYDKANNLNQIAKIKQQVNIPVIANGDFSDHASLYEAIQQTQCDAFMIARAGTGKPWLYQTLLTDKHIQPNPAQQIGLFMQHLQGLAALENEYRALLQSKSLIRYYFKNQLSTKQLHAFYQLNEFDQIEGWLKNSLTNLSEKA